MKKILIVDDVPGWIRFHEHNIYHLNIQNIEIDTAFSAKEALAKLEVSIDNPYDVIFTDLQMESDFLPKFAGEWLIGQIKTFKEYNPTKVVIISASPNIKTIAQRNNVLYLSKTDARNSDSEVYREFLE